MTNEKPIISPEMAALLIDDARRQGQYAAEAFTLAVARMVAWGEGMSAEFSPPKPGPDLGRELKAALAELKRINELLHEHGIDYPQNAAGVSDALTLLPGNVLHLERQAIIQELVTRMTGGPLPGSSASVALQDFADWMNERLENGEPDFASALQRLRDQRTLEIIAWLRSPERWNSADPDMGSPAAFLNDLADELEAELSNG